MWGGDGGEALDHLVALEVVDHASCIESSLSWCWCWWQRRQCHRITMGRNSWLRTMEKATRLTFFTSLPTTVFINSPSM